MNAQSACMLSDLLAGLTPVAPAIAVRGLALDTRQLRSGEAFLAVRGTHGHGLAHLPQALARGASAIVWEPADDQSPPQAPVPCVEVQGLSVHVGEIAARFFGRPSESMFVAGVTGTDGKTSTAHLIAQALDLLGRRCGYVGTLGSGSLQQLDAATHTTPDPVSLQGCLATLRDQGIGACAMEVSSHALEQNRVGAVRFAAAVLTNLSRDHLDYHGTLERYAAAKRRLFEVADGRALILNRDDAMGAVWIEAIRPTPERSRLRVYGIDGDAPAQTMPYALARDVRLHPQGLSFELQTEAGQVALHSTLLGRFNVYNLLAAVSVLREAGRSLSEVAEVLAQVKTVPGRIEAFRGSATPALAVVDYAHTPKALEQVLDALRAHTAGALHCVFGCGGDRDRGKRALMGEVAARLADRVTITDDNPRSEDPALIVEAILQGVAAADRSRVAVQHERARAIEQALHQARAGDVVLIAGKGHEATQTYGDRVVPFSDREFVANCMGAA